jgi:hypothetical protein
VSGRQVHRAWHGLEQYHTYRLVRKTQANNLTHFSCFTSENLTTLLYN